MAEERAKEVENFVIPFNGNTTTRFRQLLNLGKDQYFKNGVFWALENPQTGKRTFYFESRPGYELLYSPGATNDPKSLYYWGGEILVSLAGRGWYSVDATKIYYTNYSLGTTSTICTYPGGFNAAGQWEQTEPSATNQYIAFNSKNVLAVIDTTGQTVLLSDLAITSVSATNPAVVTTAAAHNFDASAPTYVILRGVTGSTPDVNGTVYQITWLSTTTFSIPVNCTVAGTGGTLGDFPDNTGALSYMDGYFFVITKDGRIFNSEFNDPLHWQPSKYITAQMYPGEWVSLARQNNFLLAFSTKSVQAFFNNANDTGSPLNNYESGVQQIGCELNSTLATNGSDLMWVGTTTTGGKTVYLMQGLSPPKDIATPTIRGWLPNLSASGNGFFMKVGGKNLYVLASNTSTQTVPMLVYDLELDLWSYWAFSGTQTISAFSYNQSLLNTTIYFLLNDGKIYGMGSSYSETTDNGSAFEFAVQTERMDFGTMNRKFMQRLELQANQTDDPALVSISYTDDDYVTYSTARTVDTAEARCFLPLGGNFRRRAFKFSYTGDQPQRWSAFQLFAKFGRG